MPKATARKTKTLCYAPYVPLRGYKVNSQLTNSAEHALLRELVTQLGGSMVGIQHNVSYYVHDKEEGCASDELSPALADFIGRHTNQYDQLITCERMFEKLNDLLSKTCPSPDGLTVRFRNTVYPIRNQTYSAPGVPLVDMNAAVVVDLAALTYKPYKKDPWDTTDVVRIQLLSVQHSSKHVGVYINESLFALTHEESLRSSVCCSQFNTLKEGRTWLEAHVRRLLKLDLFDLKVGSKKKVDTVNVEVIQLINELEEEDTSDYDAYFTSRGSVRLKHSDLTTPNTLCVVVYLMPDGVWTARVSRVESVTRKEDDLIEMFVKHNEEYPVHSGSVDLHMSLHTRITIPDVNYQLYTVPPCMVYLAELTK